jgi:hypothetical protein
MDKIKTKKKKVNNPNGSTLRLQDEQGASELAKLINFAMLGDGRKIKLKALADILQCDYHGLWASYRGRRKLPLPIMVRLCEFLSMSLEDATLLYLRQPVPPKKKKEEEDEHE